MTETRALTTYQPITPSVWEMVKAIGPVMHQSRLFGVNSAEAAMAIMAKGIEVGFPMMASFEYCQVVMGKVSVSPRGCLALIHQAKDLIEVQIKRSDELACTVWMKRKDTGFEFEATWTMEDAIKANLVKPDSGWMHYPANMLRWRCIGFVADVVCPDVIGGMKRADELGANISADGDVIDGQFMPVEAASDPTPPATTVTLDDLVDRYGVDAIMAAAGGIIPGTVDEVAAVAERLANG